VLSDDRTRIPGLHDHHLHLRATAAARASVDLLEARDLSALSASGDGWLRAVNYHESIAGPLDRWRLDAVVGDRPVRVQHRTGELWVLSSAACRVVGLDDGHDGRLWRSDEWLRERVPPVEVDLAGLGADLARLGVTAVTDTTPGQDASSLGDLALLPQRVTAMVPPSVEVPDGVTAGPHKLLLDDATLPTVDELRATIASSPAGVAAHCVTRVQLVAYLAAGPRPGDRVEHGALISPDLFPALRGLTVVTQPNFVVERAEQYRAELDADDLADLYRCRSLLDAGIDVRGGTDAPYGRPDPWAAMRAAVERDLGPDERVTPEQALRLFTGTGEGDWCVLGVPLEVQLRELDPANVAATYVGGVPIYEA
jgi:predicted amidohydrolase YtcJ